MSKRVHAVTRLARCVMVFVCAFGLLGGVAALADDTIDQKWLSSRTSYKIYEGATEKSVLQDTVAVGEKGTWRLLYEKGFAGQIAATVRYFPKQETKSTIGFVQLVRAGLEGKWTTSGNNSTRVQKLDPEQLKKTTDAGFRVDGHMKNQPYFNAQAYKDDDFKKKTAFPALDDLGKGHLFRPGVATTAELVDRPSVTYATKLPTGGKYVLQFVVSAVDVTTGEILDTMEWGGYGEHKGSGKLDVYAFAPEVVKDKDLLGLRDAAFKYWNDVYESNKPNWFGNAPTVVKIPGQGKHWGK